MRRGLTIAALMAGVVTISTLPAAAQGLGYYEGWNGPPRGFGISIGFGSPYYGNWGYGGYAGPPAGYAYSAPAGYAYSAPAGYAYPAPVEYGVAGWGGPRGGYAYGGPIYAYEPDYTYGPSYAYETYTTGPGYGYRRARVGARAEFSEGIRSREVIRSGAVARERNVVRTQNRTNARLGSNQVIRGEQTVGRGGAEMRGNALGARAESRETVRRGNPRAGMGARGGGEFETR
jgi:hypothetical protein